MVSFHFAHNLAKMHKNGTMDSPIQSYINQTALQTPAHCPPDTCYPLSCQCEYSLLFLLFVFVMVDNVFR